MPAPSLPPSDPVVAVLLEADSGFGTRVAEGVRAAARTGPWRVLPMASSQERLLETLVRDGRIAGVVGAFLGDRWVAALREAGRRALPVVNVGDVSAIRSVPSVVPDNEAVGRLAAAHLLETGAAAYGVVADPASQAARLRAAGFAAALAEAGRPAPTSPPRGPGYAVDETWAAWAASLPRPLAVFCTDDFLARRLVRRCRQAGLAIPDDVAVAGAGDSPIDSVLAGVPLTSVRLPAERIGERAFRTLEALLRDGGAPGATGASPPPVVRIAPDGVSARESTALRRGVGPLVGRALALADAAAGATPDVATLARACHCSRRTLELAFRRELGRGPGAEIRRRRIDRARRLLADTDLAPAEVARLCGFADSSWFWTAFRRAAGATPLAYRAANLPHAGPT